MPIPDHAAEAALLWAEVPAVVPPLDLITLAGALMRARPADGPRRDLCETLAALLCAHANAEDPSLIDQVNTEAAADGIAALERMLRSEQGTGPEDVPGDL